ncbi:hypothetical protein C441_16429 [Haloferax sulfurifontis ATCC BAA-897]|uniref:Uncharacterized protein n=1 Tax=Haloferax sulfurifontis ATCC BAA-897 TaxID=662480 RepID=M0I133_9EURY|nr:hypothetical protein C441_16429 [Haloferax sulfurifontis ATCC BAA-897]
METRLTQVTSTVAVGNTFAMANCNRTPTFWCNCVELVWICAIDRKRPAIDEFLDFLISDAGVFLQTNHAVIQEVVLELGVESTLMCRVDRLEEPQLCVGKGTTAAFDCRKFEWEL